MPFEGLAGPSMGHGTGFTHHFACIRVHLRARGAPRGCSELENALRRGRVFPCSAGS
jgi:hypothetical protein